MNIVIPYQLLNRYYCKCAGVAALNTLSGLNLPSDLDDIFNSYDGCAFE